MNVYEHIYGIKEMLEAESTIDGNSQYNDWQALLKLNRDEESSAFGPKNLVDDYVYNTIAAYLDTQKLSEIKELSATAVDEMSHLLGKEEYEYYSQAEEFVWEEGVIKLFQKHLFKQVDSEACSETYFDEHNHDMSDILNQMSIRIEQLKKIDDEKVKAIAEELDWFREMLYEYD